MHKLTYLFAGLIGFSFLAAFSSIGQSGGGPPADQRRVWVQYHKGKKDIVRQALLRAGARLHYDFAELDSFVVTLPAPAINTFKRNPDVKDVWYAQLTSRQGTN